MELATARPDIIHLELGEPDFATPDHVIEAAVEAARTGFTRYTPNRGILSVREAMARKIQERNHFDVDPSQIVVTTGAVNALVQAVMVVCDPGDTLLIPDPGWPNYEMMARVAQTSIGRYRLLRDHSFLPDLDHLEYLCRESTRPKAIVVNSPGNPGGGVYDRPTIERLIEIAGKYDLYLISDECYEDIVFEGEHISPAAFDDAGRVISVFSVSKSYAMTGWRVGYLAASPEVASLVAKLQETVTACASSVAQKAAEAAISGEQECVARMREAYRRRRDVALEFLNASGLLVSRPQGGFYVIADTSSVKSSGYELSRRLIVETGVAVAPGETFGPSGTGMVRISLATGIDTLREGLRRFSAAIRAWS